jgi:hypothetical protein
MKITKLYEIPASCALAAWRLSRDPNVETPMAEVLAVDAPVNEMPCYVLLFEDFTILEREIFTTPRNHAIWARTSRVDDPLQFTVPEEYKDRVPTVRVKQRMQSAKLVHKPQDTWRGMLPVLAHTSWVARISLRDLVKMTLYFNHLADKCKHFNNRWLRLIDMLWSLLPEHPQHYSQDLFLNEQYLNKDHTGRAKFGSGWTILYANVPLMLRAQIVRHRPIHFIDDLFFLLRHDSIYLKDLTTPIYMELVAPDTFWQSIMAKRNCWISQADIWHDLTVYFADKALPCKDGVCPFGADNQLRMQGKDPNPPCPIYLNLTKQDQAPYQEHMLQHAKSKPAWWKERINA